MIASEQPTLSGLAPRWTAQSMQLVNWGGFHGHTQLEFAPTATLLSGHSGSGKSTLLDAYLALMMPHDTAFNGASNDAVGGRARSADQRNLISYLRGKTDDAREAGSGELREQVQRGGDAATWGGIAVTFVSEGGEQFTAARVYYLPRGVSRVDGLTMQMLTYSGYLPMLQMDALRVSRFDKRSLQAHFPGIDVTDTYARFAQTLYTRLGIGANGDGAKALRLLARIQTGHRVHTVDDLYKSLVLEEPGTFKAADNAVEHFADLDAAYQAMLTEADKEQALSRLPELHLDFTQAQDHELLIDTYGMHRDGDTPFGFWYLRKQHELLDAAETNTRAQRLDASTRELSARAEEARVTAFLEELRSREEAAGGGALRTLDNELSRLDTDRAAVDAAWQRFDQLTAPLQLQIQSAVEFRNAQATAEAFLTQLHNLTAEIDREQDPVLTERGELKRRIEHLVKERDSLAGRQGRVPFQLHEARLEIARAANIDPADLPFVAELIDVQPTESRWRQAIETMLHGTARVLLIDERQFQHVSSAIDAIHLRGRIRFEAATLASHVDISGDPSMISGKLQYKASPYSQKVAELLRRDGTDALCVESVADLSGSGRRVTVNGQMRQGRSGSHGQYNDPAIIGFSNVERLAEIEAERAASDARLSEVHDALDALRDRHTALRDRKSACDFLLTADWQQLDFDTVLNRIAELEAQRARILAADDQLRAVRHEIEATEAALGEVRTTHIRAKDEHGRLEKEEVRLIDAKDAIGDELTRIERTQAIVLTDQQAEHLTAEYAANADPKSLAGFEAGIRSLKNRLDEQSQEDRERMKRAANAMNDMFANYQKRWFDPSLGTTIASCENYLEILRIIRETGLHERRREWTRRLTQWSSDDLVSLKRAFESSIEDIEERLLPINDILRNLPFGARRHHLKIDLRRLQRDEITKFRRDLTLLASGTTADYTQEQIEQRFTKLQDFIGRIRLPELGAKVTGNNRDYLLDVRKHVEITAVAVDEAGVDQVTYAALGGKSGGETQELVAFIVGAALRFQLGDEPSLRPRFAPVFLDEGFVKSDSEFAGRAVTAWKGLGFQLIIAAPLDKVTALEPHMEKMMSVTKSPKGHSHIAEIAGAV